MLGQTACRTRRLYTRVVNKRGSGVGETTPGSRPLTIGFPETGETVEHAGLDEFPLNDLLADAAEIRQGGIVGRDE